MHFALLADREAPRWTECPNLLSLPFLLNEKYDLPSHRFTAVMEAVGAVASIIAVVQLADRIASACKSYIEGVKDYPKDLRVVYLEIKSLAVIFETLQFFDDSDDSITLSHLQGSDGPLEGCRVAAEALSSLIPTPVAIIHKRQRTGKEGRGSNIRNALEALAWPFKVNQARKLLEDINRHKSTISVAIEGTLL